MGGPQGRALGSSDDCVLLMQQLGLHEAPAATKTVLLRNYVLDFCVSSMREQRLVVDSLVPAGIVGSMISQHPRPPLRTLRQLLAALSHCHDSGRIHNDLKFDNIMPPSSGLGLA